MVSRETLTTTDGIIDYSASYRHFFLLPSESVEESVRYAREHLKLNQILIIDTTKDFNQNKWLGKELENTLIFINNHTTINAILSIIGCIRGGYCLIIAYDKTDKYSYFKETILFPKLKKIKNPDLSQQNNLINNILPKLSDKKRITHLIGERGTGKSTLLGQYIQSLLSQFCPYQIILVSPSRQSSANTLYHIKENVPRETLRFLPPSELVKYLNHCNILIIDEAASISHEILEVAIATQHIEKIILSTTIDGYEGTGQSYRLNLLTNTKENNIIRLIQPKRFSLNDPLYQLSQQLYRPITTRKSHLQNDGYYLLNHKKLRENKLTASVFSLLREAHYRSTPNDLANFYDRPAIFVFAIKEQTLIGAIHALSERLSPEINPIDIIQGTRRPKNAMTQQALIHAYGHHAICHSKILRISRIAVDEAHRRQQHASLLVNHLATYAVKNGYDFISTSFSGNQRSLSFWFAQGFVPVRIGLQKNKWNNEFALLMIKSLTQPAKALEKSLAEYFNRHFLYFSEYYQQHAKEMSALIRQHANINHHPEKQQSPLGKQKLIAMLDDVINYHRDINWILPVLAQQNICPEATRIIQKLSALGLVDKTNKKNALQQLESLKCILNIF